MLALALSAVVFATPSLAVSSESLLPRRQHHRRMKFNATDMQFIQVESPPTQVLSAIPIFDARFAKRERKSVIAKYTEASNSFKGIGLRPMENIPFADNFPIFDDPSKALDQPKFLADSDPGALVEAAPTLTKMPLTGYIAAGLDVMYYGPLRFGSNTQELSLDFDTGSADLWVTSDCAECDGDQYDEFSSATNKDLGQDFSVSYGSGEVSGKLVEDAVSIGGITVKHQAFGAVSSESSDFEGYPNNGILGLAFSSISSSGKPTLFDNLMKNGQVATPFFSVHLTRHKVKGSEVCLGCYDPLKATGPVTWVPLKSKTYWSVHMNGLRYNSTLVQNTDVIAAIDTGTTLVYVPESVAREFYESMPGTKPCKQIGPGFFSYPCDNDPEVSLIFSGKEFSISPHDFNLGKLSAESNDCVGGIVSLGSGFSDNIAIIGDEFLKSWYSVYDHSNGVRVGFAPSVNN